MIQPETLKAIGDGLKTGWASVGPLVGVIIGAMLTRAWDRRKWINENRKQEYRELLTTLTSASTALIDNAQALVQSPAEQIFARDEYFKSLFSCPNYFSLIFLPKLLAELGIPYFRRFVGRQFIDRWTTSFELRRLLRRRGAIVLQRAVRLHPPFFEQLDYRLSETNPLRRVNDWIFSAEDRWGDRFPLNYWGQHTLCMVQASEDGGKGLGVRS